MDGDFAKLQSFKMDMPDLDFSSPEHVFKSKQKVDRGSSSGQQKGKLDTFDISFDFDGFNLDEDIIKVDGNAPATKHTDKIGAGCERHDGSESSQTEDSAASEKIINHAVKTAVAPEGIEIPRDDSTVGTFVEHAAESSSEETVGVRTEATNQQGSSSDVYTPIPWINVTHPKMKACPMTNMLSMVCSPRHHNPLVGAILSQSDVPSEADYLGSRVTVKSDAEHTLNVLKSINENQKQLSKLTPLNTNGQEVKKLRFQNRDYSREHCRGY
ncbi:unnamed protein product [Linum tenue]|uniref:Uncharacterized protein n=1 Tax=Linum tenue TaxID=586396 RepID=A0AAV0ME87_9ROSI|nr:unnamed protein product [Linum tenue]